MPPRSLGAFLHAARAALTAPAAQRPKPLSIVVGNESADLDSLCSSILLAYFRSHMPPYSLHVPLCNLDRGDLVLRPELQAALAGAGPGSPGVPLDSLVTLSEIPDDLTAADSRWLLVDHNALTGDLARRFHTSVVGCIDHHVDEGVVPQPGDPAVAGLQVPRIIATCGSCASLVVEYARDAWRQLAEREPDAATDAILAHLAIAPILVDTSDLQSVHKTVDVDRQAVALAEGVLARTSAAATTARSSSSSSNSAYDRAAFYAELSRLKDDISTFSYRDILRKDYKQWREQTTDGAPLSTGFSTVVQGMGYLLRTIGDRDALLGSLRAHAREKDIDIAVIMTVQHDEGGFARQLLLWALNERAVPAVQRFVDANREKLDLQPWGDGQLDRVGDGEWLSCWKQHTGFSRKQVAPLLRKAMAS